MGLVQTLIDRDQEYAEPSLPQGLDPHISEQGFGEPANRRNRFKADAVGFEDLIELGDQPAIGHSGRETTFGAP
jgi:hypothetical protein